MKPWGMLISTTLLDERREAAHAALRHVLGAVPVDTVTQPAAGVPRF